MSMMKRGVAGLGALVLLTAGCSSKTATTTESSPAASPTSSATPAAQPHNAQDLTFTQQMIAHHQQAVEMSEIILTKTDVDPKIVDLATQIKSGQGSEIILMQGWLSQWGEPSMPMMPSGTATSSTSMMPGMPGMDPGSMGGMDHGNMSGMAPGMEGMMSAQEMTALKDANGADAGKMYLTMMIEHHKGAITAAQTEIKSGQSPAAVALANSIVTSQQKEIDNMQSMLS